ncbi:hypothetical protein PFISCL1PPCAC_1155, partial [Pristionchus fissidentatus]
RCFSLFSSATQSPLESLPHLPLGRIIRFLNADAFNKLKRTSKTIRGRIEEINTKGPKRRIEKIGFSVDPADWPRFPSKYKKPICQITAQSGEKKLEWYLTTRGRIVSVRRWAIFSHPFFALINTRFRHEKFPPEVTVDDVIERILRHSLWYWPRLDFTYEKFMFKDEEICLHEKLTTQYLQCDDIKQRIYVAKKNLG